MTYLSIHGRVRCASASRIVPARHARTRASRGRAVAAWPTGHATARGGARSARKRGGARTPQASGGREVRRRPGEGRRRAQPGPGRARPDLVARHRPTSPPWRTCTAPMRCDAATDRRSVSRPGAPMARDGRDVRPATALAGAGTRTGRASPPRQAPAATGTGRSPRRSGGAAAAAFPARPSLRGVVRDQRVGRRHRRRIVSRRTGDDGGRMAQVVGRVRQTRAGPVSDAGVGRPLSVRRMGAARPKEARGRSSGRCSRRAQSIALPVQEPLDDRGEERPRRQEQHRLARE